MGDAIAGVLGLVGDVVSGQFVGNPVGRCRLERRGSGSHKKMLGAADLKPSHLGGVWVNQFVVIRIPPSIRNRRPAPGKITKRASRQEFVLLNE